MIILLVSLAAAQDGFSPAGGLFQGAGGLELLDPNVGEAGAGYLATTISSTELIEGGPRRISAARFSAGYVLAPVARLELDLPWLASVVDDGLARTAGDLRVGLSGELSDPEDGIGLGIGGGVRVPTSTLSEGLSADLRLAVGDRIGTADWRANIGGITADGVPAVVLGVGGEQRVSSWARAGAEVWGSGGGTTTIGVAHGYLNVGPEHSPLMGTLAGGVGIAGGPLFRVALGLSWRWGQLGGDLDHDGIGDGMDACPAAPEDPDGYADSDGCPDPDDDLDGIGDLMDLCPQDAEDLDGYEDTDGCPEWDNDHDGTLDADDACPDAPGPVATGGCPDTDNDGLVDSVDECPEIWGRTEAFGCPDIDGDRVPDYRDDCPHDPAPSEADPLRSDGCPSDAFVGTDRINILGVVNFALDEAIILPESFPLLLKVAALIAENRDIALIEIAGYTDDSGPEKYNRELSERRAGSVRRFLVESGRIEASRLVVTGYGESRPMQPNDTEVGQAANRRVEFVIVEVDGEQGP